MSFPTDEATGLSHTPLPRFTPGQPELTVTTAYRKERGLPFPVSVWTITQLKDPQEVRIRLPQEVRIRLPQGWKALSPKTPGVKVEFPWLSWKRYPESANKIGGDGDKMLWLGAK